MVTWDDDASAGAWIARRLGEFGPTVDGTVPRGYTAYAGVAHPGWDDDGTLVAQSVALALLPMAAQAQAEPKVIRSEAHSFRIVTVTSGLDHPWSLAWLPDGRMLVTEKPGRLRIVGADGKLQPKAVAGLPEIAEHGQGGLHDVVLHPRFGENGWVYLAYAARGDGGTHVCSLRFECGWRYSPEADRNG